MAKRIFLISLLFLFSWGFATNVSTPNIAVLTLDGDTTTSDDQRLVITERLQMELINSGAFRVLDRARMKEILQEQGFIQSGACDEKGCQVEIGRLLGVEKLVSGKVVDFAGVWSMSLSYTDVATGQIENSVATEVEGKMIDLLKVGTPQIAEKLVIATRGKDMVKGATSSMKMSKRNKWIAVGVSLAVGIAGGVFGYMQNKKIQDKYDVYHSADSTTTTQAQHNANYAAAVDARDKYSTSRNIGYGVGALGALSALSFSIWF